MQCVFTISRVRDKRQKHYLLLSNILLNRFAVKRIIHDAYDGRYLSGAGASNKRFVTN